jgi:uncharacterized protein
MVKWQGGRRGGIEDRRGMSAGTVVGGGGLGAVVIALIGYFVFGIDPQTLLGQMNQSNMGGGSQTSVAVGQCPEGDKVCEFTDVIHTSANDTWAGIIPNYQASKLVLYEQGTQTGCGMGQSAMGPFYCPADNRVYLDLAFIGTLERDLGARGDFALAYVIGHEVGHHVQNVLGISDKVQRARQSLDEAESNALSVKLELQADCFAGVWAVRSNTKMNWLEAGDLEEAMNAAAAVGDDTLQKRSSGQVVPDSFTHGSSKDRQRWFKTGYATGDPKACDTFA